MTQQKSILIIEDDETYAELLELLLEEKGFEVDIAHNGQEMCQKLRHNTPNLFVIDYNLPGTSGTTITKRIRQNVILKNLPVIMVSANHDIRKKAMESGSDYFFAKPISFQPFVSKITELLP